MSALNATQLQDDGTSIAQEAISRFVPPVISVTYAWQKGHARNLGVSGPLDKL
jgi:hypothetical protein